MSIDIAWKLSFGIHLLIAQGGFVFLTFYRFKSLWNSFFRSLGLFIFWLGLNIIFNGCPLTHLENKIFKFVYGIETMPNYSIEKSWAYYFLKPLL